MTALRPLALIAVLLGGLFALKSVSLADGAMGLIEAAAAAQDADDGMEEAAEDPVGDAGQSDATEAESGTSGPVPALPPEGLVPGPQDEPRERSGSELALLSSLSQRRAALDAREEELDTREAMIEVAEQDVEERINVMEGLHADLSALLGQLEDQRQARMDEIVEVYAVLEPDEAAAIMVQMDEETLLPVAEQLQREQGRRYAAILGAMPPDFAARLTVRLRQRGDPPETAAEVEAQLAETGL